MRLGELLVQEKLVSADGIQEALEAQVVHGGRLGTNLVELGLLQEADLARMLGKLANLPHASGEMTPDPRALELLDPDFCDAKDVLPMRADQTRLSVACINPGDLETIDQIAFKTGRRVSPVVVPEFRMNQLLRRYCKAFRTVRSIDLNTVRKSRTLQAQEAKKGDDLMSEDEFNSLYASVLTGGQSEDVLEGAVIEEPETPPRPTTPAPIPRIGVPSPQVHDAPPRASVTPPQMSAPVPRPPVVVHSAPPPPVLQAVPSVAPPVVVAKPAPPSTPIPFAEAQRLLKDSTDREDIARTILRFAVSKWRRALILSVQGGLVSGWHGAGQGIREKAVQRIGIALRSPTTFKLVCDLRSHYVGPMKRDAATAVFYKLLGGGFPQTAVILPLLVREKIVHLLYVDNGPDQLTPPDIGELLIVGQNVTRSYETLMRKRLKSA